ncbi:hypothetical protein CR513_22918, partial [Mucuna pruriens]
MEQQCYHYYVSRLNDEQTTIMAEGIICIVQELFQVDVAISPPPASLESQHQQIPLWMEIILYDNKVQATIEDSMQNLRMIPTTKEVIYTSWKKSTLRISMPPSPYK